MALEAEKVWGMCIAGRFMVYMLTKEAFARVAQELVVCDSAFSGFMNGSHEGCIIVERGSVPLRSFLSSEEAGRSRVALRVSMALRRDILILVVTIGKSSHDAIGGLYM